MTLGLCAAMRHGLRQEMLRHSCRRLAARRKCLVEYSRPAGAGGWTRSTSL